MVQSVAMDPVDPVILWEEFGPPLRGFLARRVPPGVDADDLLQDVFLRVIRSLSSLRRTDRPEAWLYQIARNAVRDSLRARLRREPGGLAVQSQQTVLEAAQQCLRQRGCILVGTGRAAGSRARACQQIGEGQW